MMAVKLVNSAMMPQAGRYIMLPLTRDEAAQMVRRNADRIESFIGYQNTADFIARISGTYIPVSRAQATLESGDTMLVCRLKHRVSEPSAKGKFTPGDDDYEFFVVTYVR